jgi:hypothetical protein
MHDQQPGMLRREFLKRGLGTWAGVSVMGMSLSCRPMKGGAKGKSKLTRLGFTTYTWGKPWDIPTLIANCDRAGIYGVELRTSQNYAHGLELETPAEQRREAKKRFQDSPVTLVGMASGERYDALEPAQVKAAVENSKGFIKLSHDVGGSGVRVFPNDFHKEVPREQTIAQIARALNEVGAFAADYGQQVRLEAHGSAGTLTDIRAIMDQVTQPSVRVKLNSDARDTAGQGFEHHFKLVKNALGDTLHLHNLKDEGFPYQQQMDLLVAMGWTGWQMLEVSHKVPDPVAALIELREIWDGQLENALNA